ncbi:molybdopterin-dependent oxidoreductase [Neomoorella thermoacetica]|uniref:molybdopterin-dependent oxidoreductase n=1 Tax=Neomoorella thermoacetica TaxID=1525 RepID=UPI0008FB384C|nr:molybdopterin-dependent oxidoreductase [Moorella thermoacetica]OIQ54278.1 putative dimethyl sulfoxide reductase chain YnfF precursor [Moorella thermoacetica]
MAAKFYRHICPRNCYSTCGLISMVEGGKIKELAGDPAHGYSRGHLCRFGYSYLDIFHHPARVLYPLRQEPRGSGNWRRIGWDEAMTLIAGKMLELKGRWGSFLPVFFYSNSGNIGLLHQAWNWLARSLGEVTVASGSLCWSAGLDAMVYGYGAHNHPDPAAMARAGYLLLWGANPAWTAVHQMEYIYEARERGARLVVIDPIFTATAARADFYVQIKPGSDGALALGLAHQLWQKGLVDNYYLENYVRGWPEWREYLAGLDPRELVAATGVPLELMARLAEEYAAGNPAAIWIGIGLQRHINGGQNIRAINALAAMTGNLGREGGGVYYASPVASELFTTSWPEWMRPAGSERQIPVYDLARGLEEADSPPVKMALLANANPLAQNATTQELQRALANLDLVVLSGQFLTETARAADVFLPVTTFLESWDVVPSYWHRWIGINEPAVSPGGECRSDIQVVSDLARVLNQISPGCCPFPSGWTEEEWLEQVFNPEVYRLLGINHYRDLLDGPRELKLPANPWAGGRFATPSGRYEIYSDRAAAAGLPSLPVYQPAAAGTEAYPYRLLTPHTSVGLNSQFYNLGDVPEPLALVNPRLAREQGLHSGSQARLYNEWGEIIIPVVISELVPPQTILCHQRPLPGGQVINDLTPPLATDMGTITSSGPGLAYYDTFVNIAPVA